MNSELEKKILDMVEDVGAIKSRLKCGDKDIKTLDEQIEDLTTKIDYFGNGLNVHLEHHKTTRWVIGVGGAVLASIAEWFKS